MFDYGYVAFLFILLYLGHYVADYMFQRSDEAMNKITDAQVRFVHSFKYGWFTMFPVMLFFTLTLPGSDRLFMLCLASALFLIITHYLIDDRKIVAWITNKIKGDKDISEVPVFVIIEIDQTLHKILLLVVALYLAAFV